MEVGFKEPELDALQGSVRASRRQSCAGSYRREKTDLRALEVANSGHVPLLDEPEYIDAIKHFLSELGFAKI